VIEMVFLFRCVFLYPSSDLPPLLAIKTDGVPFFAKLRGRFLFSWLTSPLRLF